LIVKKAPRKVYPWAGGEVASSIIAVGGVMTAMKKRCPGRVERVLNVTNIIGLPW